MAIDSLNESLELYLLAEDLGVRRYKLRGEVPDIYQYENIEQSFRVQVVQIVQDTIGVDTNEVYDQIHKVLCKEYGVFTLKEHADSSFSAVFDYFLIHKSHEKCLDIIEHDFQNN